MDNYIIKKKLDLYEKFFEEMNNIEQEEIRIEHERMLYEPLKCAKIEDNFIELDSDIDLKDLNIKEQQIINEQNNIYEYEKLTNKFNKIRSVYDIGKYMVSIPRWVPFI